MSIKDKIVKEFKLGNTIKVIEETPEGVNEFIGKYVGVYAEHREDKLYLIGFKLGEYKTGEYRIPLEKTYGSGGITGISRSRLTGKTGEYVNKVFESYIKYLKQKQYIEEKRRKEEEELTKLRESYDAEKDKYSPTILEDNKDKLSGGVLVYEYLESKYGNIEGINFNTGLGMNSEEISISRKGDLISIDFPATIDEGSLKYITTYLEYDNSLHLGEITKEKLFKEFETQRYKVEDLNGKLGKKGKIKTEIHIQPDGYRVLLQLTHKVLLDKGLSKEEVIKLSDFIYSKCILPARRYIR